MPVDDINRDARLHVRSLWTEDAFFSPQKHKSQVTPPICANSCDSCRDTPYSNPARMPKPEVCAGVHVGAVEQRGLQFSVTTGCVAGKSV